MVKYTVVKSKFARIKSVSSFEVNNTVQINQNYEKYLYLMLLSDRKAMISFDSDLNILYYKQVPDARDWKLEGDFLEVASGSMFFCLNGRNILNYHAKGYKFKIINSLEYDENWYSFERDNDFGLLAVKTLRSYTDRRLVDDYGSLSYVSFTGLPKDIQYVIMDPDENGDYWIYAYTMKNIIMIPYDIFYKTTFGIKTVRTTLPTKQTIVIDWNQYVTVIVLMMFVILANGFVNIILRFFK